MNEKIEQYYYVLNTNQGQVSLLGYNLTREEKDKLFYCFKSPSGNRTSSKENQSNSYGCHTTKFKTKAKAVKELITISNEINNALKVMAKYNYVVFPNHSKIDSYSPE